MDKTTKQIFAVIEQINKRLDSIETMTMWLVKANQRFKKGQRVRLSPMADRARLKLKGGGTKGTVTGCDGFSVDVLPDGYKKAHGYFHGFWEPVTR
jgi:hypothetical protein